MSIKHDKWFSITIFFRHTWIQPTVQHNIKSHDASSNTIIPDKIALRIKLIIASFMDTISVESSLTSLKCAIKHYFNKIMELVHVHLR